MSIDIGESTEPETTDRPSPETETVPAADANWPPTGAEISDADEEPLADDDSPSSDLDALDAAEEPLGTDGFGGADDSELTDADLSDSAEESVDADGAEERRDDDCSEVAPPQEPPTATADDVQDTDIGSSAREMTVTQDSVPVEDASVSPGSDVDHRAAPSQGESETERSASRPEAASDKAEEPAMQEVGTDTTASTHGENTDDGATATGSGFDQQPVDSETAEPMLRASANATDETAPVLTRPDSVWELTPTDHVSHEYVSESPVPTSAEADSSSPSQNKLDATVSFIEEVLTTEQGADVIGFIDREVFRNADAISKHRLVHPEIPGPVELDTSLQKMSVELSHDDLLDTHEDAERVGETGEIGAGQQLHDASPESPANVRAFLRDVMGTEYRADLISFIDLTVDSDPVDSTFGTRMTVESKNESASHGQSENSEVKLSSSEGVRGVESGNSNADKKNTENRLDEFEPMPPPLGGDDNGELDRSKWLQPGKIVEVVEGIEVEEFTKGVAWTVVESWKENPNPDKAGIELAGRDNLERVRDMARERGLDLDQVSDFVKKVTDAADEYVGGLSLTAATAIDIVLHWDDYRDWAAAWAADATYRGEHRASEYRGKHRE